AGLYQQHAHAGGGIHAATRALQAPGCACGIGWDGSGPGATDPARDGLLQGPVAERPLVPGTFGTQRLGRNARRLVRATAPAPRLCPDRLPRLWREDPRYRRTPLRSRAFRRGAQGSDRLPQDALKGIGRPQTTKTRRISTGDEHNSMKKQNWLLTAAILTCLALADAQGAQKAKNIILFL